MVGPMKIGPSLSVPKLGIWGEHGTKAHISLQSHWPLAMSAPTPQKALSILTLKKGIVRIGCWVLQINVEPSKHGESAVLQQPHWASKSCHSQEPRKHGLGSSRSGKWLSEKELTPERLWCCRETMMLPLCPAIPINSGFLRKPNR